MVQMRTRQWGFVVARCWSWRRREDRRALEVVGFEVVELERRRRLSREEIRRRICGWGVGEWEVEVDLDVWMVEETSDMLSNRPGMSK